MRRRSTRRSRSSSSPADFQVEGAEPQAQPAQATQPSPSISSYSSGVAFALASFSSIGVTTLFTSILTARIYGVTIIGQAALVLAPVSIVTLLSTVREQPAMVRRIAKLAPRHPQVTGVVLAVFSFSFALTLAVTIIGIVVCYFVFRGPLNHPELFAPTAVALCGYLLIINTCWNIDGLLGAFRAGKELFSVRLHQAIIYGVLIVALSFATHSVWCLVVAFLGSWLTALVHRVLLVSRVLRLDVPKAEIRVGFSALREILTFGLKITPGSIAGGLSEESGTWILALTNPIGLLGAFSRASNIATRFGELNWRVTEMLLPTIVQRRAEGDAEGYNRVIADSLRYVAFGLLLPASVGAGAAHAIMHLFGSGFGPAAPALRWLLLIPLLQTITAILGSALMAANRPMALTVSQAFRLLVSIAGGVLLTLAFGITGMAVALSLGCVAALIVNGVVMRAHSLIRLPSAASVARQLVGLGSAYAGAFFVAYQSEKLIPGLAGLVVALAAGSLAYVLIAIGLAGLTSRDRQRLGRLLERARRRTSVGVRT